MSAWLDDRVGEIDIVAGEIEDIIGLGVEFGRHAFNRVPIFPIVIYAVNRRDRELHSRPQVMGIVLQLRVHVQDGLGFQIIFLGDGQHGIAP
jgi:hypothetical protein